ncbi:MAG: methyltransferase [Thermomicrobiales bacterium]|nr:methyltransferase [Thermomicrobiales bacterium]
MSAAIARLDPDPECIAEIRRTLERVGFDAAQQALRPDYFTSPFPHLEQMERLLPALDPALATAIRLLAFGEPVPAAELEVQLGREFIEAGLIGGLLQIDEERETFDTGGYTLVSRLGHYFTVSANPYYPAFDPTNADVYMGPDSYTLAAWLQRRLAGLPTEGDALDLCTGSGIAGQSVAALRPGLNWAGVDLSPAATNAATFNAALNGVSDRYRAIEGDCYAPVQGRRYDLITANPPFIPVPAGLDFPVYGAGGEDGLTVLTPILRGLPGHLTDRSRAVVYSEGVGRDGRLLVADELETLAAAGLDVRLTVIAAATIENALYTLGVMLAAQRPPRLPEIVRWRDLFAGLGVDEYAKFVIEATPGRGSVVTRRVCPDPSRIAREK